MESVVTKIVRTAASAIAQWQKRRDRMIRKLLAPVSKLMVSEWADRYRMLSAEASAEPGKWNTNRAPYQRGIMDAFGDPMVEMVVCMTSSQVGKTEIVGNVVGYYMDQDPSPILVVQPTLSNAEAWSKDRLAPMLRDTPRLRDKVKSARSRDSGNAVLHKLFSGGNISIVGANSAADLAGRPKRILLGDEIDRWPASAGTEGDPWGLARRRTANFWNRKLGAFSTPTLKGFSRIDDMFQESDQRFYHVPCPDCGFLQKLVWAQLKWENKDPDTAAYCCISCGVLMEESHKRAMLEGGTWIASNPGSRIAGFHLNALYSPWARWSELVREWLAIEGSTQKLQVFVNTILGETWEEQGEQVDAGALEARREPKLNDTRTTGWGIERYIVPMDAGVLVGAVDVQGDRLELKVKAFGAGEESWLVHYAQLMGDPANKLVWDTLNGELNRTYVHEGGAEMRIVAVCIDTGGHHAEQVYRFTRKKQPRIWPTKGVAGRGRPIWGRPGKSKKYKSYVGLIGVDTAKDMIFARMRTREPGPGYMHIPKWADSEYLAQLTSEKAVKRIVNGRAERRYRKTRERNEGLDLEVYCLAALNVLGADVHTHLAQFVTNIQAQGAKPKLETPVEVAPAPSKPAALPPPRRGNWVTGGSGWKI